MENILISGSQESAEVIDKIDTYKCICGHEIQVSCGIVLTGSLHVIEDGTVQCDKCGETISLKDKKNG